MRGSEFRETNLVQLTGRVRFKRYSEENGTLFLALTASSPKPAISSPDEDDMWNRENVPVILTGDDAKRIDEEVSHNEWVTVIGHMDTRRGMVRESGRLFRETWEPVVVPDFVKKHVGRVDANTVVLIGKVLRVYRNAERGKRFYVVTLKITDDDGKYCRVSFTYFDPNMELEPEVGDVVMTIGKLQSKEERHETNGRRETRRLLSVVSRNAVILEKAGEEEGEE